MPGKHWRGFIHLIESLKKIDVKDELNNMKYTSSMFVNDYSLRSRKYNIIGSIGIHVKDDD